MHIAFGLVVVAASTAYGQSMPRNSYLDHSVKSTKELVHQAKIDPAVMDRYSRHFAMTHEEVLNFLASLKVSALNSDGVFVVFGVPHRTGDLHAHLQRLKKGEPVFAQPDGTPVLLVVCGNPLTLGPKQPALGNSMEFMPQPQSGLKDLVAEAAPVSSESVLLAETPGDALPVPAVYPLAPHEDIPILPFLLGIGGSIGITTGHRSSPPPVPEPMSLVALGGGLAALVARKRRKR